MEKNQVELEYDHFAAPKELTDLRIKPQRSLHNKRESPPRLRLPIQGHATTCGPAKGTETVSPASGPTSGRREGHLHVCNCTKGVSSAPPTRREISQMEGLRFFKRKIGRLRKASRGDLKI